MVWQGPGMVWEGPGMVWQGRARGQQGLDMVWQRTSVWSSRTRYDLARTKTICHLIEMMQGFYNFYNFIHSQRELL